MDSYPKALAELCEILRAKLVIESFQVIICQIPVDLVSRAVSFSDVNRGPWFLEAILPTADLLTKSARQATASTRGVQKADYCPMGFVALPYRQRNLR